MNKVTVTRCCPSCRVTGEVTIREEGEYEYWYCHVCHVTKVYKDISGRSPFLIECCNCTGTIEVIVDSGRFLWCRYCGELTPLVNMRFVPAPQTITIHVDIDAQLIPNDKAVERAQHERVFAVQVQNSDVVPFNGIDNMCVASVRPNGSLWGGVPQKTQMSILRKMYDVGLLGEGDHYDREQYM